MVLNKTPANLELTANFNWTDGIVAEYILKEFNIHFTVKGATLLVKRLNLSFTRPTYTLGNADSQKQDQFREEIAGAKNWKMGLIQHILFEDESMVRDYQAIGATWFERGKQKIIKTFGKTAV